MQNYQKTNVGVVPTTAISNSNSIEAVLATPIVRATFENVLKEKAGAFIGSLIAVANGNKQLKTVAATNPQSIINCALAAAAIGLEVDANLGQAAIIPYGNEAQFQIMTNGLIQLARRNNNVIRLSCSRVYKGEIKKFNRFTDEIEWGERESMDVIGYLAYLKEKDGFEKYLFMSVQDVFEHAKEYSKSYNSQTNSFKPGTPWAMNFNAMAEKTCLKKMLKKWSNTRETGSEAMLLMQKFDQAVIKADLNNPQIIEAKAVYVDNPKEQTTTEAEPSTIENNETVEETATGKAPF